MRRKGSGVNDINADRVAAERKREQRAEFMRAYVLACLRGNPDLRKGLPEYIAKEAREQFDAIEEASK